MQKRFGKEIYLIESVLLLIYCSASLLLLLPIYFKKIGISEIYIGLLTSTFYLSSLFSRAIIGEVLDKGNPKKVLFIGIVLFSLSVIFYPFIKEASFYLYLIRVIHGISLSAILLSILLLAVMFSREDNRAGVLSLISVSFLLPNIFMPFIGEKIIENLGFGYFFSSAFLISAIPIIFYFQIPKVNTSNQEKGNSFFEPLKKQGFATILILTTLLGFAVSTVNTFTPLWAKQMKASVGVFFTSAAIVAVSIRLFLPGKLKIWGKMSLLSISFFVLSSGILLISLSSSHLLFNK